MELSILSILLDTAKDCTLKAVKECRLYLHILCVKCLYFKVIVSPVNMLVKICISPLSLNQISIDQYWVS